MTEIVQRGRLYVGLFGLLAIRFDTAWVRLACVALAVMGSAAAKPGHLAAPTPVTPCT